MYKYICIQFWALQNGFESADYRERPQSTQILAIDPEEIKKLRSLASGVTVDLDLLR